MIYIERLITVSAMVSVPMNSRAKGLRGEREFINLLADHTGLPWLRRNLEQSRGGGCDVLIEPPPNTCLSNEQAHRLQQLQRFAIEVKRVRHIEPMLIKQWWQQAVQQAAAVTKEPLLAVRQNRWPWLILVRYPDRYDDNDCLGMTFSTFLHGWLD